MARPGVIQPYWVTNSSQPNWANIGYNTPPNCQIVDRCEDNSTTHCQVCDEGGRPWTYAEWIFTGKPGVFGLVQVRVTH